MKLKLEWIVPDEQDTVAQYYHAPIAWSAIDEAIMRIRNHDKHGVGTPEQVLQQVWTLLCEARSKTE